MDREEREAQREAEREAFRKEQQKKQTRIVVGIILTMVVGIWMLSKLMTTHHGTVPEDKPVDTYVPPKAPPPVVEEAPRSVRLYDEYLKALASGDRRTLKSLSVLEDDKIDFMLDPERVKLIEFAYTTHRLKLAEEKLEPKTAWFKVMVPNKRGLDAESFVFHMAQQSTSEYWKVVKIEYRFFGGSTHQPMKEWIEIGQDPTKVAADLSIGSTFRVAPEADPTPQEWTPETTKEQKEKIEALMVELMDDSHPARVSRASQSLIDLGKPAVPRLLNELAKFDVRKEEDNLKANRIDRTLAALTDREMGYDAVGLEGSKVEGALPPAQARIRAVRRWFGWWGENKDKPFQARKREVDGQNN